MSINRCYGAVLFGAMIAAAQGSQTAVNQDRQPTVVLPSELSRVLRDYESAWMNRDSQALARLFTEDGFVLSPGSFMVRGRGAIAAHYIGLGGPLSLRAVAYSIEGNVGYIIGAFADRAGIPDRGKFTVTLRRDSSGRWLIMSDMDNGNIRQPDCREIPR